MAEPVTNRHWKAQLELVFQKVNDSTRLVTNRHFGPLRVLKPFYPESDGTAHTYLLHPPGGLVVGDELEINLRLRPYSQVLATVPSASKLYNVGSLTPKQCQSMSVRCEAGSICEWLPQETIVFNGANAKLANNINLDGDASFFGWEVLCLGRPTMLEKFTEGNVSSQFEIKRDGKLLLRDRLSLAGSEQTLKSKCGFQGNPIYGQLFATGDYSAFIEDWRESLKQSPDEDCLFAMSQIRPEVFTARYLGTSSEQARHLFIEIWKKIRPYQLGKDAVSPRIWNT